MQSNLIRRGVLIVGAFLLAGTAALVLTRAPSFKPLKDAPSSISLLRSELQLQSGKYCTADSNLFSGIVVEHYASGALKSRSTVSNGLLHGISQGWFTNAQVQIIEHFVNGVAHGERTKFYADGKKLSRTMIVDARVHGTFEQWHPNGTLAAKASFERGEPHGLSEAWFTDGSPKSRVILEHGKVIEQNSWDRSGILAARSTSSN